MAPEDIRELFAAFGAVLVRRMFGGAGIYAGETMFALVHDGVLEQSAKPTRPIDAYATLGAAWVASGSASPITRLRPLRLAA